MTQHNDMVEQQRQTLELEKQDKQVVCIETRHQDGIWTQQTIDYADGRRVTEFRDSRKKTIEENRYGKD
tara:strand:+ start:96 stop:302 length:207 start_codon:yes stop_codon:yes gene_type:complete